MNDLFKPLPFDHTGEKSSHRIVDELNQLNGAGDNRPRFIIPKRGWFYADSVSIKDRDGNAVPASHYQSRSIHERHTLMTGRSICGVILITDSDVTGPVSVTYQALGGPRLPPSQLVSDTLAAITSDESTFSWDEVVNKPDTYQPASHVHEVWQVYGAESWVFLLQRLADACRKGENGALEKLEAFLQELIDDGEMAMTEAEALLNDHIARRDNPHGTQKHHVGLGDVENKPLATADEMLALTKTLRYMTPKQITERITTTVDALNDHIARRDNPHGLDAHLVGAYTTSELDGIFDALLDLGGTAPNTQLLGGSDYSSVKTRIQTNIPADNVTKGVFDPARLGDGPANQDTVLMGDGTYRSIDDILEEYQVSSGSVFFIDYYGSPSQAVSHISSTFSGYPIGTIVLYRDTFRHTTNYGNGAIIRDIRGLRMVIRNNSGWTDL